MIDEHETTSTAADRRRTDRRTVHRIGELSLPEVRRIVITTTLFIVVLFLFVSMVRTVIIAGILGVVIGAYIRPLFELLRHGREAKAPAAFISLALVILPILGLLAYSYSEIADVAQEINRNREAIASRIDAAVRRLPIPIEGSTIDSIRRSVLEASNYGARIPLLVRRALSGVTIQVAVFLFTAFYVLMDAPRIAHYVRTKIPLRYDDLLKSLEINVKGVLYGAIYSTLLTQSIKSVLILLMNMAFGVPLAGVLAILSFIIGFFPIVGSWSVYVPVALWLLVFRDSPIQAGLMVGIGFIVNTLFISNYLRPKIAAERSGVLNFYWMFIGLITGVYTFGLPGILLGPILIGLLKAIVDSVTATGSWTSLESDGERRGPRSDDVLPVPGQSIVPPPAAP